MEASSYQVLNGKQYDLYCAIKPIKDAFAPKAAAPPRTEPAASSIPPAPTGIYIRNLDDDDKADHRKFSKMSFGLLFMGERGFSFDKRDPERASTSFTEPPEWTEEFERIFGTTSEKTLTRMLQDMVLTAATSTSSKPDPFASQISTIQAKSNLSFLARNACKAFLEANLPTQKATSPNQESASPSLPSAPKHRPPSPSPKSGIRRLCREPRPQVTSLTSSEAPSMSRSSTLEP
jgi:hypothetical protein